MTIDALTGLPELPEGRFWEVVETNYPILHTLRVDLREEAVVTKTKTVMAKLPKKWYQTKSRTEEQTVEYTAVGSELVDSEYLLDDHVHFFDMEDTQPDGPGWEPELKLVAHPTWFSLQAVAHVNADSTCLRYYRRHPNTPDSVRAAAEKILEREEKKREKDAALLREAEERAMLVGKYPPKTLKG